MKLKLKNSLIILVLFFTVIPAAIIYLSVMGSTTQFYNEIYSKNNEALVKYKVSAINECFNQYISDISFVAGMDCVDSAIIGNYEKVSNEIDELIKLVCFQRTDILDILILDNMGGIITSSKGPGYGSSFFGFNDEMQTIETQRDYISDINVNTDNYDSNVFFISKKLIIDNHIGYVVEVVDIATINSLLKANDLTKSGKMFLMDSSNNVLNYSSETDGVINLQETSANSNISNAYNLARREYNTNDNMNKYSDSESFGNYSKINPSNWVLFGIIGKDEIKSTPSSNVLAIILILSIPIIVFIILGIIISETVTSPMKKMTNIMSKIRMGDRDARFELNSHNEFGSMADSLNDLLDEIILSEERHRTISNISDNMLFEWDFRREKMYVSDNFLQKFDLKVDTATLINGKFLESIMNPDHIEGYTRCINALFKNGDKVTRQLQLMTKNGSYIWVTFCAQCITDRLSEILRIVGVITDIDNEKRLELRLAERASFDFLSQLYNRPTFERQLINELKHSVRLKNALAVVFIDLDDFKLINDRFGHSCGDDVIKFVADTVKKHAENKGFAGRFGGDEFVMCITDEDTVLNIEKMATSMINSLYEGFYSESGSVFMNVKASIGISIAPQHGDTVNKLLSSTDEAMYYVKKHGKANYHIYDPNESVNN